MSNHDETILEEQLYILRDFLFNYSSYRIIHENIDELNKYGSQEYWVLSINAHYFQAINLWCMVFGTNNNETHWRKLGLDGDFKNEILSSIDFHEEDYDLYWNSVIEWRNKYSAHRVPGYVYSHPVPDLKLGRKVVFLYEKWLNANLDAEINFSLEAYEQDFSEQLKSSYKDLLSPLIKQ